MNLGTKIEELLFYVVRAEMIYMESLELSQLTVGRWGEEEVVGV
jgi:hypothetical protein